MVVNFHLEPDAPPQKMETWPSKKDEIRVYWSPIPESFRNGIITGYRIFYKKLDEPVRNFNRAPRSVSNPDSSGALPGEKFKNVNGTTFETNIDGLVKYSWYQLRIGALTSKGLGPTFQVKGTCKQGGTTNSDFIPHVLRNLLIVSRRL